MAEINRIESAVRRAEPRREGDRERPEPGGELERRLHHLRVAAENLKAAGLHDQAHRLMEEAERIAKAGRRDDDRPGWQAYGPRRVDRPDQPRAEGSPPQLQRLQGEVTRLRQELNEMRGLLQRLVGERGDRPERRGDEEHDGERPRRPDREGPRDGDRER